MRSETGGATVKVAPCEAEISASFEKQAKKSKMAQACLTSSTRKSLV